MAVARRPPTCCCLWESLGGVPVMVRGHGPLDGFHLRSQLSKCLLEDLINTIKKLDFACQTDETEHFQHEVS